MDTCPELRTLAQNYGHLPRNMDTCPEIWTLAQKKILPPRVCVRVRPPKRAVANSNNQRLISVVREFFSRRLRRRRGGTLKLHSTAVFFGVPGKSQSRIPQKSGPEPRPAGRFPGKLMRRSRPPDFIAGRCGRFWRRARVGGRERSRLDGVRPGPSALILAAKCCQNIACFYPFLDFG